MVRVGPRGRLGRWALLWSLMLVLIVAGPPWRFVAAQVPEPPPQEPPTFELPEVIVPGRRPQPLTSTPASVSVITREEIEHSGARTVADLLRQLPEVSVRTYGGPGSLAEASIRGSSPAQVLVLLDGVPLNNVALGQTDLTTISVDGVERIELLRGPFGAIYGSGALGGVINVVTSRAPQGQAVARTGGYGQHSVTVSVPAAAVDGQFTMTADTAGGTRPNSDYTGTTVAGRVNLSPDTRLLLHYYRADLGTPGDVASPTPNDRQAETRTAVQLRWEREDHAGAAGRIYAIFDDLTFAASFGTSIYRSSVLGGELQRMWNIGADRQVTAGLEIQRQALAGSVSGTPIDQAQTVGAGYLQYDAAVSDRALVSLGLRTDAHSLYGTTVNPRAGVVVRLDEHTRLRAAVGRTFRGPTFLELFFPLFGCANPSLQPETAWAAEVGVERQSGPMLITVTAFGTEATNLIVGGCPPQNVGAASIRGLSVETRAAAGPVLVTANVTATRAIDATTGSPLLRVPGFTANLAVHRQGRGGSVLTLLAAYEGPRLDVDVSTSSTVPMPGYVNLQLRYSLPAAEGWMLTIGVDNVLDQQYETVKGYPAPGRTAFIAATTRF